VAAFGLVIVVGVAFAATALAAFAQDAGRRALASGDLPAAADAFETAERLDPGLALYPRLLGAAEFLAGDHPAAEAALRRAVALNPNDDLGWRTLAVVQSEGDLPVAALDTIERAVALQRADPTNLLFRNGLELQIGLADRSVATSGEIIQAWPWLIGGGFFDPEALDAAVARAADGEPSPQSNALNTVWVAALAGDDGLLADAIAASGLTRSLGEAYAAAVTCGASVPAYLDAASAADRRFDEYWALRVREANAAGHPDAGAERAWEIMTGRDLDEPLDALNPLDENGFFGLSADTWGYRRPPVTWPDIVAGLPSPDEAYRFWLMDPAGAAHAAGLVAPEACR
jgi:hypothetical protein